MKIIKQPLGGLVPKKKRTVSKKKYQPSAKEKEAYISLEKQYMSKPLSEDELIVLEGFKKAVLKDLSVCDDPLYIELHKRSYKNTYYVTPNFNQKSEGNFFEDFLCIYARAYGFTFMKVDVKGTWSAKAKCFLPTKSTSGMFDVILQAEGNRVAWIEVKGKGDSLKPNQIKLHAKVKANGGTVFIFKSIDDLHDIHKFLTA